MYTSLAETLRVLRARKDLTVTEAASKIGISRETLRNLEHGRKGAHVSTLEKIADTYGVSVSDLLAEEEERPLVAAR